MGRNDNAESKLEQNFGGKKNISEEELVQELMQNIQQSQ